MTTLISAWVDGQLRPVEKLDAHRRGLRHKAVSVFVTCGEAVLIQRRALGKYHTPGLWANTCCTHPDWGETAEDCAHRRLREELGLSGVRLDPKGVVEYRADVGGGLVEHEVVEIFTGSVASRPRLMPDPTEVLETEWVEIGRLVDRVRRRPADFTPWLAIYLDLHFQTIFA